MSDEIVANFVKAKLPPQEIAPIDAHLDSCEDCRMLVAALAGTFSEDESAPSLAPAPKLGRYVVLDILGQGAMGIVYGAYDPRLDRKIAIKLLHPEPASRGKRRGPSRQERFLREAKAMARLIHPNVVTVHDTGTAEDQVFVAMEYVDGLNLREWLSEQPRDTAAIVDAFSQAGTGLAAAHNAGIVHRDFKPDNVFVAKEGAVKVGDFGLVSFAEIEADASPDSEDDPIALGSGSKTSSVEWDTSEKSTTITQTGTRLGTALYMSPEQFDVSSVGPASDQFSFCVAFYEALYGVAPFAGNSGLEIRKAIEAQKITAPTGDREVASKIHRAILRGLQKDPSQRHDSMQELVRELHGAATGSRSRWLLAAILVTLLAALVIAIFAPWHSEQAASCSAPSEDLAGVWDDKQRGRLGEAFSKNPNSRALETSQRVSAVFDRYAEDWLAMRVQTCEATHVQGHQSAQLMDLRVHCLNRKLAGLRASTETFVDQAAKSEFVDIASSAVLNMPVIRDCMDTEALLQVAPRPTDPEKARKLSELEARLDQSVALEITGQLADALAPAQSVVVEGKALGYAPLYLRALYQVAFLQYGLAQYEESEGSIALLVPAASTAGDDLRVADAWLLRQNIAVTRADYEEAIRLEPWVDAAVLRSGDRPAQRSKLLTALATVHLRQGRYQEAETLYRKALTLMESQDNASLYAISSLHLNLGITALTQGKNDVANEQLTRALALKEQELGPNHPDLARVLLSICSAHHASARYDEAEETCGRCLRIREQSLGNTHPDLAHPLTVLADLARKKKDMVKARALYERALAVREAALDPMHPDIGNVLTNFGDLLSELGEHEKAGEYLRRALAITRQKLGEKHQYVGISLHNLGNLAFATKDKALAIDYQEQALALFEEALGPEHPYVAFALSAIGEIQIEAGKAKLATAPLRRALSIRGAPGTDPLGRAQTEFLLAKALFLSGAKAEALALAHSAEREFRTIGESGTEDLDAVMVWLKSAEKP